MNAAISFVEYLFTGTFAILWLLLILPEELIRDLSQGDGALLALVMIPILYALGMLIDFLSGSTLDWAKALIRESVRAKYQARFHWSSKVAAIYAVAPELGVEYSTRSTRDRIARGLFANLIVLAVVVAFTPRGEYLPFSPCATSVVVFFLAGLALGAWWRFERLSTEFKYKSIKVLEEIGKLRDGPAPNPGPQADV